MKTVFATLAAAGLIAASSQAMAAGADLDNGRKLAEEKQCVTCHGLDGNNEVTTFPKLGGQYADYLEHALRDYRSGARRNAIMAGQAANLTDVEIRDLSAWYASQGGALYTVDRD